MAAPSPGSPSSPGSRRRHRTPRLLATVLVGLVSCALLMWVAPPESVIDTISHLNGWWVLAAVALELGSCVSYVVVFRRFFPEPPRAVSRQVAWMAMGAGAVLPGGNISSAAATGWLLRKHGVGTWRLLERCGALLCLLTLFGFAVNGVAGVLLLIGVGRGPHDLLHTGGPILVSAAVLGSALAIALANRRLGERSPRVLRGLAAGIVGAWAAARSLHWRMLGAVGFLCLDMAALWAATGATGHPLGLLALAIAYCIGYLATMIPMPAGLGVLDSGLAGSLVLYGLSPSAAVSAVLVYHAISIWVPGLGGLLAWLPTRVARRAAHDRAVHDGTARPAGEAAGAPRLGELSLVSLADGEG